MIELLLLILHIVTSLFKPRAKLAAEILVLRQQLNVLRRQVSKRPQLSNTDRMTISLAFLAPDLVKAAIEGRLPHGMGVVRLADLPAEWSRQHQMLGLSAQ